MGQGFLYESDLIFQSIKSVISISGNTTITLHSPCNGDMLKDFALAKPRKLIAEKITLIVCCMCKMQLTFRTLLFCDV